MKNNSKVGAVVLSVTAILFAVVGIALRCVNLFYFYETQTGYYYQGAVLPIVSTVLLIAALVFFFLFSLLVFKKKEIDGAAHPVAKIFGAIPAVAAVAYLAACDFTSEGKYAFVLGALSVMTALYFICSVVDVAPFIKLLCAVLAIIRLLTMLSKSYFNMHIGMNSPDKLLFEGACALAVVFIACEIKTAIGAPRPWFHLFVSAATTLICSAASVPSIIASNTDILHKDINIYAEYYVLFGIAVCSAVSLFCMLFDKKNAKEEPTDEYIIT